LLRVLRERAENLPQSVLRVYRGQPVAAREPLESHRLRRLISRPNPVTGEFEFLRAQRHVPDLAGNSYWLIQRGRDGTPAELWPLRPDLIRISRPPTRGCVLRVFWTRRRARANVTAANHPDRYRDIIHVKYPNPLSAYFGQPPCGRGAAVSLDNSAHRFRGHAAAQLRGPGVVIKTATETTQAVADMLKRKWKAAFGRRPPR